MKEWTVEFFEDLQGRRPVEKWLESLTDLKREAAVAAIQIILKSRGIDLIQTKWLKPLGSGLFEFRIRHSALQIIQLYQMSGYEGKQIREKVLLRIFLTFHGERLIVLLGAYDKSKDTSPRNQSRQIALSRKRLKEFKN